MRTVSYQSVLQLASQLAFGVSSPNASDAATLNTFINERLGQFWRLFWWPELMVLEQRKFRDTWSGSVAAGTEVYYAPTQSYYLAIKGPTTVAPATLSGSSWVTNQSEWIEAHQWLESGSDWQTGLEVKLGEVLRNPSDDKFYACHTAHTAGGSFDATKFGVVRAFRRSLDYVKAGFSDIDSIRSVTECNPETYEDPGDIQFTLGRDILVDGNAFAPWLHYRTTVPSFTGSIHDPDITYVSGDQVYWGTDFYRALATTTALPSDATKWLKLGFPFVFRNAVPRAAFADWLDAEGQPDKSNRNESRALKLLQLEIEEIERNQRQVRTLPMRGMH